MLAGCSQADGIDESGAIYDGIAPDAAISLNGTEPFWAIEIAPGEGAGYTARYSTPEDVEGRSFVLERFAGNNGLGFSGKLDGAPVQIAITPGECSDGMSDRTYPFTATVALGDESLFGCAHTDSAPFEGPTAP
jgi:uncharacterized membrane protein